MEEERKLAHIEKIEWIKPIEGADKIVLCGVLGWQCIVAKKDNFKEGDKIVYIEIDSVVPDIPEFEFLRDRKFRVKTIKLKGELSQGLVVPLSILGKNRPINLEIGDDVTDLIGITKYLSPSEQEEIKAEIRRVATEKNRLKKFLMRYGWFRKLNLSRKQKSGFPYWVSKTDEERIQNMPRVLTDFANEAVYATEKIDGQSATFTGKMVPRFNGFLGKMFPKKFLFVVCSRNLTTNDRGSLYWRVAKKYNLERILKENPKLTIQGEQIDTKVQGNKYKVTEPELYVFNIIDHENKYQYNYEEMQIFCNKHKLKIVPLIYAGPLFNLGTTVNEMVESSKGLSWLINIPREGLVVRNIKDGKKVFSFKCINPDFLLKFD